MTAIRPLRVFICHSSKDKSIVRELYQKLCTESWIEPWLDEEELYPGQDWDLEIKKAVERTDVVIVGLSNNSVSKEGYIQRELRLVLDAALTKPEGTIFIIPLRFEECEPPHSLHAWQYADYFEGQRERAFQRLLISLRKRADSLGLKYEVLPSEAEGKNSEKAQGNTNNYLNELTPKYTKNPQKLVTDKIILSNGIELMHIPAGKFLMGIDPEDEFLIFDGDLQHIVDIAYEYWMARFPVTNELYNDYIKAESIQHPVSGWENRRDHPVTYIQWLDALRYCQWLDRMFNSELPPGLVLRLPTEAEWEKAARGTTARVYPWGDEFDKNKCNSAEGEKRFTTPVGLYSPLGDSPYGCADMAGNVWEWTHSLSKKYPYSFIDGREDENVSGFHILRGGSFYFGQWHARCACRANDDLLDFDEYVRGFRVVAAPKLF